MRSRHTGQVGSSTRAGVLGANGLTLNVVAIGDSAVDEFPVFWSDGTKGSLFMLGKLEFCSLLSELWNVIDLMKTTWQYSGFKN
jgi:hypothetical protein